LEKVIKRFTCKETKNFIRSVTLTKETKKERNT